VFKRLHPALMGVFCAMALMLAAAPEARAELQVVSAYEAGEIADGRIYRGTRSTAERLIAPFVGAIHAYVEDDQDGRSWWLIATGDGEQVMALCPEPTWNNAKTKAAFEGEMIAGPFRGARVTGTASEDDEGKVWVTLRVRATGLGSVDVEFVQPLEPTEVEFSEE
jgi:hypothetical protein